LLASPRQVIRQQSPEPSKHGLRDLQLVQDFLEPRVTVRDDTLEFLIALDPDLIRTTLEPEWFTLPQKAAVEKLAGREFHRAWEFLAALEQESPDWRLMPAVTKDEVKDLEAKRQFMLRTFRVRAGP